MESSCPLTVKQLMPELCGNSTAGSVPVDIYYTVRSCCGTKCGLGVLILTRQRSAISIVCMNKTPQLQQKPSLSSSSIYPCIYSTVQFCFYLPRLLFISVTDISASSPTQWRRMEFHQWSSHLGSMTFKKCISHICLQK